MSTNDGAGKPNSIAASIDSQKGNKVAVAIVNGTNRKPAATLRLVEAFEAYPDLEGELLIGYPVLGATEGRDSGADAIYLSRHYGAILFDLIEGTEIGDFVARQDDLVRLLQGRLYRHRELVRKRELAVSPECLTFAPAIPAAIVERERTVANQSNLVDRLNGLGIEPLDAETFSKLASAVQNISTLRKSRDARLLTGRDSYGARLAHLEDQISTLDPRQSEAVLETIDGVQRIRGLAGSGKTIVLALKAAYLHAQHPDWRIAVTFNTRSLMDQFRTLITAFVIEQASEEPDWEKVQIVNAWGGRSAGNRGLYFEFCSKNGIEPMDFTAAERLFGRESAFSGACRSALESVRTATSGYDVILVDEAQDLPSEFLRLCYEFLGDSKRLVYAYDELQNLSGTPLPSPTEIFGKDEHDRPRVTFDRNDQKPGRRTDVVLEKCYRNSAPVLVSAHAVGFGVYRRVPDGTYPLVQIFDDHRLWGEIGYRLEAGATEPGERVVLSRTKESSPEFLEKHSDINELIEHWSFHSKEAQDDWAVAQIQKNLASDELRYRDLIVINPDPVSTRKNMSEIRAKLAELGIRSHVAGVDTSTDVFFERHHDSVTFSGVFRAKGNEAGMVYVLNAQEGLGNTTNLALVRNRLFTAITRSKAWVRVAGVGPLMNDLSAELQRVRDEKFRLDFEYPTDDQKRRMRLLHREVNTAQGRLITDQRNSARELLEKLESGDLSVVDLDDQVRNRLREILENE